MVDKNVMIITPFSDFGNLISQSICKNNTWKVNSVSTIKSLASIIYNFEFLDYALLDMELGIEKVRKSAFILRDKFPEAELILISKKEPPEEVDDLRPWRLLSKPFVEKDLLEIFFNSNDFQTNQVIEGEYSEVFKKEIPAWARDKDALKNILVNTISNLDVQEAIIYADNIVLAQNKNIREENIHNCSSIISKYMDVNGQGELIKQIRLNSDCYLLHATILAVGIILALLYNPDTPYKNIRHQTRYIATRIVNPQLATNEPRSLPESARKIIRERSSHTLIKELGIEDHKKAPARTLRPRPALKFKKAEKINPGEGGETMHKKISGTVYYDISDPDESTETFIDMNGIDVKGQWTYNAPESDPKVSSNYTARADTILGSDPEPEFENNIDYSDLRNSNSKQVYNTTNVYEESERARVPAHFPGQDLSQLNFACLLIPRIKTHPLAGDLARYLDEIIPAIFLAYGWRLETLIIEKQYMQWIVRIPSAFAPSNHIKIVRKESSKMILGNFARLNKDGLITDFWAPGYLLEGGKQPISDQEIAEFIQANRQQYYPDDRNFRAPKASYFTIN